MAPVDVVLVVVMLRIATTLGDLLNFALGSVFMLRRPGD
jgi:membrane protein DedA with SNARE-associated domain